MTFFKWVLSFFGGKAFEAIVNAYKAKLEAGNTRDAKATELAIEEIKGDIAARNTAKEIIIAEQGRWYTAIIRPLFALPFVIFAWKVVVWDKVLKLGTTDAIDPNMWSVFLAVVASYFGLSAIDRISKVFRR